MLGKLEGDGFDSRISGQPQHPDEMTAPFPLKIVETLDVA
jgi:hypothetical protein